MANYTTTVIDNATGEVTQNIKTKTVNAGPILGTATTTTKTKTTTKTTTTKAATTKNWLKTSCPAGWTTLDRTTYSYRWCYKVFTGSINQADAEKKCNSKNAHLSGLIDSERNATADAISNMFTAPNVSVWTGMWRFQDKNTNDTAGLMWMDGKTANKSMNSQNFFTDGNPDNLRQSQLCGVMYAFQNKDEDFHGRFDDTSCAKTGFADSSIPLKGYICGKLAT